MNKTFKILLWVLLAVLAVHSVLVIGQYFYNFHCASANVITEVTHAGAPVKKDEGSLERRINRLLCRASEFFTPPVKLPKGYYLKETYGVVSLHDMQGKRILDENASHFCVKEPYVAVWGINTMHFLNTDTGEITSAPGGYYMPLPRGGGRICIKDFLTFWDITTGYKPITWSQK